MFGNKFLLGPFNIVVPIRDGKKIRTRRGPDPQIRFDWGIPELTGDGDGDGESPNYKTGDGGGDGDNKNPRPQTRTRTFNV